MTSKLMDNNRRTHAAKVLAEASKKNQTEAVSVNDEQANEIETEASTQDVFSSLNNQYEVIREDILKLREDLAHGYDLLKEYIDSKVSLRSLIRSK